LASKTMRGSTSLDLFLRAYAKRKTFANDTKTIPEVQDDVRRVVVGMEPRSCKHAMENFEKERESESDIPQEEETIWINCTPHISGSRLRVIRVL